MNQSNRMDQSAMESCRSNVYLTPPIEKSDDLLTPDDIYSSTPDSHFKQLQPYNLSTTHCNPLILQKQHQQYQDQSDHPLTSWNYKESELNYMTDLNHLHQRIHDNSCNYANDSLSPLLPALYLSESSSGLDPNSRLSTNECETSLPDAAQRTVSTNGTITMALDLITNSKSPPTFCWNTDSVHYSNSQPSSQHDRISANPYSMKPSKAYHSEEVAQHQQSDSNMCNLTSCGNSIQNKDVTHANPMWTCTSSSNWVHNSDQRHNSRKHQTCFEDDTFHCQLVADTSRMNYCQLGPTSDQLAPVCWDNLNCLGPNHGCYLMPTGLDCCHINPRSGPDAGLHWNNSLCSTRRTYNHDLCMQTYGHNQTRSGTHLKTNNLNSNSTTAVNDNNNTNNYAILHPHICANQQQTEYVPNIASSSKHYAPDFTSKSADKHCCFDPLTNTHLTQTNIISQSLDPCLGDRLNRLSKKRHCKRRHSCNRGSDTSSSQHTFNSSHHSSSIVVKSSAHQQLDSERIRLLIPPVPSDGPLKWIQNSGNLFRTLCVHRGLQMRTANFSNRDSMLCDQIQFRLKDFDIWAQVCVHDTEMIATNTGRRIFPSLSVDVFGLNPTDEYIFVLDMVLIQPHVFKHQNGKWIVNAQSDEPRHMQVQEGQIYIQEDSPKSGAYWMESGVNFIRAKITNSKEAKRQHNMIHVHSMQHYLPRFTVIRLTRSSGPRLNLSKPSSNFDSLLDFHTQNQYDLIGCFVIPGTQFYTVTAYQNPDVIRIKINNNPFAKGFRNRQDNTDLDDNVLLAMGMCPSYTDSSTAKFA